MSSKECTIYNNAFFNDLYPYSIDASGTTITFSTGVGAPTGCSITNNVNLSSYITEPSGFWRPAIIDVGNSSITNKAILGKVQVMTNILGIENAIEFDAHMQHWSVSGTNNMVSNWFISKVDGGIMPEYGVLCWYREKPAVPVSYDEIPEDGVFYVTSNIVDGNNVIIPANTKLQKLSKRLVLNLDASRYDFQDTSLNHHEKSGIIDISSYTSQLSSSSISHERSGTGIVINNKFCDIWISDGEFFSYFNNSVEKSRYNSSSVASHSYISPCLMETYRSIYHSVTKRKLRGFGNRYSRKASALLQKLCYILSTAPQIDRVTEDYLSSQAVYNIIQTYLASSVTDTETEKTALLTAVDSIMKLYHDDSLDSLYPKGSMTNNYISNKGQLYTKLLTKYGAVLRVLPSESMELKYKPQISNHMAISLGYMSTYNVTNNNTDTILYSNMSVRVGQLEYASNMSSTTSQFNLNKYPTSGTTPETGVIVPLSDLDLPPISYGELVSGNGVYTYNNTFGSSSLGATNEIVLDRDTMTISNDSRSASYNWELYSGPNCLRFSDYAKDRFNVKRFASSSESSPRVFMRQSAEYELKVSQLLYRNIAQSTIVTLVPNGTSPTIYSSSSNPIQYTCNKILCASLKTIAFHKKGMVWLLDTDHYYYKGPTSIDLDDYDSLYGVVRLKDALLNVSPPDKLNIPKKNTDETLTIKFTGGTAGFWLISAQMEHMRTACNSCKSFYREKIIYDKKSENLPILGASNFKRASPGSITLHPRPTNTGISEITFSDPPISTDYAPSLNAYGGYDKKMVDQIGIRIPYHPNPGDNCQVPIPDLHKRNDYDMPTSGVPPQKINKYCFQTEIQPTGNHYVTIQPGHFHPGLGWQNGANIGNSAVISNKPDKQQCLTFKGGGFFNMRPGGIYSSYIYLSSSNNLKNSIINNNYGIYPMYGTYSSDYTNRNFLVDADSSWTTDNSADIYTTGNICGHQYVNYTTDIEDLKNKTIETIEVKLNFLNYPNVKNLKIWLEAEPALSGTAPTVSSNVDLSVIGSWVGGSGLTKYADDLKDQNTLYLLNEENIHNYTHNFVITFSDHANKYTTTSKYNSNKDYIIYNQRLLNNHDKIMPSIKCNGYSDYNSEHLESLIKHHNIHKNSSGNPIYYVLSCLNGHNFTNSKFSLHIQPINDLYFDDKVLDNLSYNDQLAGRITSDNKLSSNTALNSLCSWEIRAYTKDIKNPISYDYTNGLDYSLLNTTGTYTPYTSGYNYWVDLKDKEYLLPLVNFNAPYQFLANINSCLYIDDNLSRDKMYSPPTFPSLMPYFLATMGFGFGTILGGLTALFLLNSFYSNGGRNDPIINYFIETKLFNQTQDVDGQYYKPVYTREVFGQADKGIVALSQDDKIWYGTEVSIFKSSNTPALSKKKYRYVKVKKNSLKDISDIPYSNLASLDDLQLLFPKEIVPSGGDPGEPERLSIPFYSQYSILSDGDPIPTGNIKNGYSIVLSGSRPYHLFKDDTNLYISSLDREISLSKIALVATSGGSKTVMSFNEKITGAGYVSKAAADQDTILIYNDKLTGCIDNQLSLSPWSTDRSYADLYTDKDPEFHHSANSVGSIGWGNYAVYPKFLYSLPQNNSLISTTDILHSHTNDRFINNTITIIPDTTDNNTPDPVIISGGVKGWTVMSKDNHLIPHYTASGTSVPSGFPLMQPEKTAIVFAEIQDSDIVNIPDSGYLYIENDFEINRKINLSVSELDEYKLLLSTLNNDIGSGRITYAAMPEDTGLSCYTSNSGNATIDSSCKKLAARADLERKAMKRNNLATLIDLSTTNSDGCYNLSDLNIDGDYNISLKNRSSYWIHIDPEQPVMLLDELSTKILTTVEMNITPIVGDYTEDSQIAPQRPPNMAADTAQWRLTIKGNTYEYKKTDTQIQKELTDIQNRLGITWDINNDSQTETFTYGSLNQSSEDSKKLLIGLGENGRDNLISYKETYKRPKMRDKDNKKINEVLSLSSPIKMKFRNLPRLIKSVDSDSFVKYSYSSKGDLIKTGRPPSSVGYIGNNFLCWTCLDDNGKVVNPSPFFKNMNEMYYRGFFGSFDKIEHKSDFMDSQDAWEWIPYEFFKGPCDETITRSGQDMPTTMFTDCVCNFDSDGLYLIKDIRWTLKYKIEKDGTIKEGTETRIIETRTYDDIPRWCRVIKLTDTKRPFEIDTDFLDGYTLCFDRLEDGSIRPYDPITPPYPLYYTKDERVYSSEWAGHSTGEKVTEEVTWTVDSLCKLKIHHGQGAFTYGNGAGSPVETFGYTYSFTTSRFTSKLEVKRWFPPSIAMLVSPFQEVKCKEDDPVQTSQSALAMQSIRAHYDSSSTVSVDYNNQCSAAPLDPYGNSYVVIGKPETCTNDCLTTYDLIKQKDMDCGSDGTEQLDLASNKLMNPIIIFYGRAPDTNTTLKIKRSDC